MARPPGELLQSLRAQGVGIDGEGHATGVQHRAHPAAGPQLEGVGLRIAGKAGRAVGRADCACHERCHRLYGRPTQDPCKPDPAWLTEPSQLVPAPDCCVHAPGTRPASLIIHPCAGRSHACPGHPRARPLSSAPPPSRSATGCASRPRLPRPPSRSQGHPSHRSSDPDEQGPLCFWMIDGILPLRTPFLFWCRTGPPQEAFAPPSVDTAQPQVLNRARDSSIGSCPCPRLGEPGIAWQPAAYNMLARDALRSAFKRCPWPAAA